MQFSGHLRSEFKDDVKMYKWGGEISNEWSGVLKPISYIQTRHEQ